MKKFIVILYFFCVLSISAQLRSFNDVFPGINPEIKASAFSDSGYYKISRRTSGISLLGSAQNSALDPQITRIVLDVNPGYLVESILIIPIVPPDVSLIDVYNALGNIRGLNEIQYDSATRRQSVPMFQEATRIISETQLIPYPDPAPARILPRTEIFYIRLKDINFGNVYFKSDMALFQNGMRYTLSNFRNITFLFFPVVRKDKLIAQLYIELLNDGVLLYSIAGADISDFLASRIHIDSAITKRLDIFTIWAANGITK
jgi:hypothetical protein